MGAHFPDTIDSGRRLGVPAGGHVRKGHAGAMIRARGLEKRYGEKRVLTHLDLHLPRAGFLLVTGPNGSGKTTLLRLCAGLAAPTRGELDIPSDRSRIGFLGHEPLAYRELTALENLELYG